MYQTISPTTRRKIVGNYLYLGNDPLPIDLNLNPIRRIHDLPDHIVLSPRYLVLKGGDKDVDTLIAYVGNNRFNIIQLNLDGSYKAVLCTSCDDVTKKVNILQCEDEEMEMTYFPPAEQQYSDDPKLKRQVEKTHGPIIESYLPEFHALLKKARQS